MRVAKKFSVQKTLVYETLKIKVEINDKNSQINP